MSARFWRARKFYKLSVVVVLWVVLVSCFTTPVPVPPQPETNVLLDIASPSGAPILFADGFESGNFQAWTFSSGLVLQQQVVNEGVWAAQALMAGAGAWAYKTLTTPLEEVTVSLRVNMQSISGTSAVNFLKLRTASGTALAEVYITPAGRLGLRNSVTGIATNSAITFAPGLWRTLALRTVIAGDSSRLELSLDGAPVAGLQLTASLGTAPIGRVQVGENVPGRTAQFVYDGVVVTGAVPPTQVLFADGFETGFQNWTSNSGLTLQQQLVAEGVWAARGTMTGSGASVYKTLTLPTEEATVSLRANIQSISGTSAVNFLKVRTASGTAIAEVYLTPTGVLGVRNNLTGIAINSAVKPSLAMWHTVVLRVVVSGDGGRLEVSLDGGAVPGLQQTLNLGTTPVGRVQVGENVSGRTADFIYDDMMVTRPLPVSSDPVLVAAGDIACDPLSSQFFGGNGTADACRQKLVSDLILADPTVSAVAALGDVQYYCGGAAAFAASYDPSWGRFKSRTRPAVGNHEYLTGNPSGVATDCDATGQAAGYFGYFGAAAGAPNQGYYSYDLGAWHIIVLNSNCLQAGGCGPGSPQDVWLQADLAAYPALCTLAYWHIPLWSSGGRSAQNSLTFVKRLYAAKVEVILTGHDHIYERFAPQTPTGAADPLNGIRSFVVGTGGSNHTTIPSVAANSEVRNADTFGILRLTLRPNSYDWRFVPEPGKTFTDSGSASCH
jgi:acid phosphatase type 7